MEKTSIHFLCFSNFRGGGRLYISLIVGVIFITAIIVFLFGFDSGMVFYKGVYDGEMKKCTKDIYLKMTFEINNDRQQILQWIYATPRKNIKSETVYAINAFEKCNIFGRSEFKCRDPYSIGDINTSWSVSNGVLIYDDLELTGETGSCWFRKEFFRMVNATPFTE